ncbi:MAG: GAF domain-containing protein [Anaerolineae bacterium]|nr:GAF domain-containing protein [Anaerolineae bacterium]
MVTTRAMSSGAAADEQPTYADEVAADRLQADAALARLAQTINSTLDLEQVLTLALDQLKQVIPYSSAAIMLSQGENLMVVAARGFPDNAAIIGSIFTPEDKRNIGYQVMLAQKVRVESDVQSLADWGRDDDTIEGLNVIHGWIGAPLVFKGQTLGLLTIDNYRPDFYTAAHGELAAAFADQLAIAVQNARSYQTAQEQAKEMALLYEISQHISAVLDRDALLSAVIAHVRDAFGYQLISIHLINDETGVLERVAHLGAGDIFPLDFRVYTGQKGIIPWVAEHKQTLVVPDVLLDERYVSASPAIRSELAIPLLSGDELLGVFNLESDVVNAFDEGDVRLMESLAHQITVALVNVRLFESVRKQANELALMADNLAEEKSKLDAILRNLADGLIVADPSRTVMLVNPAFEYMFACPAARIVGGPLERLSGHPELHRLVRSAQEEPAATFSAEIPMPDNRMFKALAAAIQDDARILGTVTVVRDITHEKEVERMKTEFISAVSHELRTPLTSVLGFAKLIAKTFSNEVAPELRDAKPRVLTAGQRIQDNLDIIVVEAERLTRLINDVLDISKMESGEIEWRDQAFDFIGALRQIVENERPVVEEKRLALEIHTPDDALSLIADPTRIRQLVFNLLTNAVKFTHEGKITLTVSKLAPGETVHGWRAPLEGEGAILCTVSDTGIGIAPENMPRLFQRFQQIVINALTDRPTGTGLGLVICRQIVVHYGGVIWAESTPGAGSVFSFTLPLNPVLFADRPATPVVLETRAPMERPHFATSDTPPLLLVVDDDSHIRELLVQELTGTGYRVLEAANGVEAISITRANLPDLILLDVMMPDISGFDVTRILKSDVATASIPILILSIVSDRELGLALGADDYLIKPVESSALLSTVSRLLAQGSSAQGDHIAEGAVIEALTATLRQQGFHLLCVHDPRGTVTAPAFAFVGVDTLETLMAQLGDSQTIRGLCYQAPGQTCAVVVLLGEGVQP